MFFLNRGQKLFQYNQSRIWEMIREGFVPKIKTRRATAKRFKVTGSGKFVRAKGNKSHILTKKSSKRKRQLRQDVVAHSTNTTALQRMLPYL